MSSPAATAPIKAPEAPWSVGFKSLITSTVVTVALRALIAYTTLVPQALSAFAITALGTAAITVGAFILTHIILSIWRSCSIKSEDTNPTAPTDTPDLRVPSSARRALRAVREDGLESAHKAINFAHGTPGLVSSAMREGLQRLEGAGGNILKWTSPNPKSAQ
jgi:hypothetical protein